MKKKLFAVLLAGAMVVSTAACGGNDSSANSTADDANKTDEGSTDNADASGDDSSSDAADNADSSGDAGDSVGSGKLTVWAWDQTFNIKAMNLAAEQYKKDHPDFELEVIETSSDDCQTKLTTCANAGDYSTMPDIVLMQDNSYQKFLKSYPDAFTDLTDIGINWDDFAALKQSYSMVDGKHYGVPYDNGVCAAFYRTDILEEAGYSIDDMKDITWSKFIEIGQAVREKTGKYLLTSEATGGDVIMLMIQSCGANFVNEEGKAYITGNDIADKCVDLYTEMIQKDVVKLVNNWDEYVKTVTDGEAAGIVNGNWMNGTLVGIEDQKGLWQITTIPKVDGVDSATNYANNGGSSWYITANCQNMDLAKDFLLKTFGSSTEFYDTILPEISGIACYLPAGESTVYNEPVEFYGGQPIYSTLVEYSSHIPEFTKTPYHYEAREAVNTAIIKITDGTSKEDALKEAQETLEFKMTE